MLASVDPLQRQTRRLAALDRQLVCGYGHEQPGIKSCAAIAGCECMIETLYIGGTTGCDEMFARVTQAFIPALLETAQIASGQRSLGVATGTGDAARAAEQVVGRQGQVVAGDISATMLEVAQRNRRMQRSNSSNSMGTDYALPTLTSYGSC